MNDKSNRHAGLIIGLIVGLIIAYKRKSNFWGYVGFGLLGAVVISEITTLAGFPKSNKINNDLQNNK